MHSSTRFAAPSSGFLANAMVRRKERRGISLPRHLTIARGVAGGQCLRKVFDSGTNIFCHWEIPGEFYLMNFLHRFYLANRMRVHTAGAWMQNRLDLTLINPGWGIGNVMCSVIMDLFRKLLCDIKSTSFIIYNSLLILSVFNINGRSYYSLFYTNILI